MPEPYAKLLAIVFSLLILGQALLVRRKVGTWLFPACIFGLLWFAFTFIPMVVLIAVPVNPFAIGYILLCCLAVSLCGLLFGWKKAFQQNSAKAVSGDKVYDNGFLRTAFYVVSGLAILFVSFDLLEQGFSLNAVVSDIQSTANQYSILRSTGQISSNIFGQLSLGLTYIGAILGGLMIADARPGMQRSLVIVFSLLPSIAIMLTQSARGALHLSLGYFYGGVLISRLQASNMTLFSKKAVRPMITYGSILLVLATISFLTRGLYGTSDTNQIGSGLIRVSSSYLFGSLFAFSDWFAYWTGGASRYVYSNPGETYGFFTFSAAFTFFGSTRSLPTGVFDEVFEHGDIVSSNIYTIFRALVTDFGLVGCLVYMGVTSFIFHLSYYTVLINKRPVLGASVFIVMMAYFWQSYLGSLFIYNNSYACFALLWIILFFNSFKRGSGAPEKRKVKLPRMVRQSSLVSNS